MRAVSGWNALTEGVFCALCSCGYRSPALPRHLAELAERTHRRQHVPSMSEPPHYSCVERTEVG